MRTYFKVWAKEFPAYMRGLQLANLGIGAVIQAADCMTLCKWLRIIMWKFNVDVFCFWFGRWRCKTYLDQNSARKCEYGLACFHFLVWSTLWDGHFWDQKKESVLKRCPSLGESYKAGLSESFEVDGWVVKVSGQPRDILFKKRHP